MFSIYGSPKYPACLVFRSDILSQKFVPGFLWSSCRFFTFNSVIMHFFAPSHNWMNTNLSVIIIHTTHLSNCYSSACSLFTVPPQCPVLSNSSSSLMINQLAGWNVPNIFTLTCLIQEMLQRYCNKCSKWHPIPWTQARRCLCSSITSSTTVCCMPDKTILICCCSWSLKSVKSHQTGLCLSFCCKFFRRSVSSKTSNSYRFLKAKCDYFCTDQCLWLA